MGYSVDYFGSEVNAWMEAGWLKAGSRLIEFGGQEFYCDQDEARGYAERFLRRRGVPEDRIRAAIGTNEKVSVAAIHRALDVDYSSIDIDDKYGAAFFDLNCFAPPMDWRGAFDFVNNEGTIEHLVSPINGFQVTHELLKVGGIARHSIPLTGHRDHGFIYPTVKFYACMVGQNQYELLRSDILVGQSDLDFVDSRFRTLAEDGKPLAKNGIRLTDAWLVLVYRKTRPLEFRVPSDHLVVDDPEALAERLSGSFSAFSRMRLTASGKRDPIGDDFERQAELQRREHEHSLRLQVHQLSYQEQVARDLLRRAQETIQETVKAKYEESTKANYDYLALLTTALAIALNGAGLLTAIGGPSFSDRIAFAAGLALAFLSTMVAYTRLPEQRGTMGRLARYGTRLLWLGAAAAFIVGCLTR
jgi:SAM-dependent methyltransferase